MSVFIYLFEFVRHLDNYVLFIGAIKGFLNFHKLRSDARPDQAKAGACCNLVPSPDYQLLN